MPTDPYDKSSGPESPPGHPADGGFDIPDAPHAARPDHADPAQIIKAAADARIEKLESELATLRETWMRTAADAQNARRRAKLDVEEAHKYAVSGFAKDLLSVADNLSRALASLPANGEGLDDRMKNVVAGIQATERELLAAFERNGIRKIAAQDAPFDPQLHQAVSEVQDPTRPANAVAQVFMDGYTLNGRLMRAAMVVVAKGGPVAVRPVAAEAPNDAVDADGA